MPLYVKLDTDYYQDEKMLDAGEAAEVLYLRCLCVAKEQMRDGYLNRKTIIAFIGLSDVEDRAQALVAVGLWKETEDGWLIAAWLKHNPSAADIAARREQKASAGRKRWEHSAEHSAEHPVSTPTQTEPEPEGKTEGETEEHRLKQLHADYPEIASIVKTNWLAHAELPKSSQTPSAKLTIANTIRLLHTEDGYSWEDVGRIVEYAAKEWAPTYMGSPAKLRNPIKAGDRLVHEKIWADINNHAGSEDNSMAELLERIG